MPFGLTNALATFQRFMNHILADLINTRQVVVYLDDILIFANLLTQHNHLVWQVLKILCKHCLFLKESKCKFAKTSIEYLDHIIREGQIYIDPKKVTTTILKELQSFLGFYNYYHQFIEYFSQIAQPLHNLTGKQPWNWTSKQDDAFSELKKCLCSEPVLRTLTLTGKFCIKVDSSNFANKGILSQEIDRKGIQLCIS